MLRRSTVFACVGLLILASCQKSAPVVTAKVGIKELTIGTSKRTVEKGDAVWAVYSGHLKDGSVFDSNTDAKNKLPYFFIVGEKMVIKGWEDGVIGMKVGGKRELTIPPQLAYGDADQQGIPPNSTLIFELEVVGLSKNNENNTYFMEDTKLGTGAEATDAKMAEVHYTAKFLNGRVLDDTRLRKQTVSFKVGLRTPTATEHKAVVGLEDGVRGMKVGGQRHLIIPPNLLFGPGGTVALNGSQMIDVVVDLVSVK
jgi:peptidylprolyl isomerase